MSRGLNKVMLIGNLGQDPEVRSTNDGTRVATLSLATNFTFKNAKGDKITQTEWHRVTVWRGLAEIAEKYLKKGAKLFIEGRISYGKFTDKEGVERYTTEIVATELTMLDNRDSNEAPFVPIDQRETAPTTA